MNKKKMGGDDEARNMQKLSPVENSAVGVLAGSIEVSLLQPMLYYKVL